MARIEPLFEALTQRNVRYVVVGGVAVVIEMKSLAGRPKDLEDIAHLRDIENDLAC